MFVIEAKKSTKLPQRISIVPLRPPFQYSAPLNEPYPLYGESLEDITPQNIFHSKLFLLFPNVAGDRFPWNPSSSLTNSAKQVTGGEPPRFYLPFTTSV